MNSRTINVEAAWRRMQDTIGGELPGEGWPALMNSAGEDRPSGQPVRERSADADADADENNADGERRMERKTEREPTAWRRRIPPAANGRRFRRSVKGWLAAVFSACLLALLLSTPVGGEAWAAVMGKLRFQHFAVVQEADLDAIANAVQGSGLATEVMDLRQYGRIEYTGRAEARQMTAAAAAELIGRPVVLPPGLDPQRETVTYQPEWRIAAQLKVKPINKLIERLGGASLLPDSLDGERIALHMPAQVWWTEQGGSPGSGLTLLQAAQPQLEADTSKNFDALRRALLDLPFLTDNIRDSLEMAKDWRQTGTLPLPIPTDADAKVVSLQLNGHEAMLTSSDRRKSIVWLQDGFLYALFGAGAMFPEDSDLIERAKELAR